MTIEITKSGPFYVTAGTPISFSSLRTNFKGTNSGAVSASQLRKDTSTDSTDPTVPNATENVNISTSSNLQLSQFRNSIKRYKIRQSTVGGESAETNFDIDAQDWNSNLDKNIQKTFEVTGVIGATSTANAAATFNATAYNLKIHVFGHIYGQGGAAGVPNGGNGGNGGPALSVTNQVANNITIEIVAGGRIFGGGGGGGAGNKGADGDPGSPGTKSGGTTSTYQEITAGSRCSNQTFLGQAGPDFYFAYVCAAAGYSGYYYFYKSPQDCGTGNTDYSGICTRTVTTDNPPIATAGGNAGTGGAGGAGGQGQGHTTGRSDGVGGLCGSDGGGCGGCTATAGTPGKTGITGGNGGDYGVNGTAANPGGNGGVAGRAIAGLNYSVTGTINGDTVKGLYNP